MAKLRRASFVKSLVLVALTPTRWIRFAYMIQILAHLEHSLSLSIASRSKVADLSALPV